MRILITGASGQLGCALQTALLGEHELVAADIPDLNITRIDDVRLALRQHQPELLINCAAYTQVDAAESDPDAAYTVNATGARNLAIASFEQEVPLLQISTDYVFDGRAQTPYHEYCLPNPQSIYGKSKLAGEEAVRQHNPRHYVVRTAWLYHTEGRNFAHTMLNLAQQRSEVRVVNDQIGSPTYAPHLAHALIQLFVTRAYGTYHLAGAGQASWFDLTRALYAELGINTPVIPISTAEFPRPAPRPMLSALTSWQQPRIVLPSWESGVQAFARDTKKSG